jgi:hypothetical protein
MPVCIVVAQTLVAVLPTAAFTLAWTHSVEKIEWREAWQVENDRLRLTEAMVAGSGAGMEPPPGAVLVNGEWRYRPDVPPLQRLTIANSEFGPEYRLCWSGDCHSLASLVPAGDIGAVDLYPCR